MPLCKCGCGNIVKEGKLFFNHHSLRVKKPKGSAPKGAVVKEGIVKENTVNESITNGGLMPKVEVLELSRKDKVWVCSECNKEYKDIPGQCICGAMARSFEEKDIAPKDDEKGEYLVEKRCIYDGKEIERGVIVSLSRKDRVLKSMLDNGIVTPVKKA